VRFGEYVLGHALGPDAVAALDLVEIRDLLPGENARVDADASELVAEPAGARVAEPGLRELGGQHVRVRGEGFGRSKSLGGHRVREPRRTVVGVDEPVDVLPQPEPQCEVALHQIWLEWAQRSNRTA